MDSLSIVPSLIALALSSSLVALLLWFPLMYQEVHVSLLMCPSISSSIMVSVLASCLSALAILIVFGPFFLLDASLFWFLSIHLDAQSPYLIA